MMDTSKKEERTDSIGNSSTPLQLQYFTHNEARALHSMCKFYNDTDTSTSTICMSIINDMARNHNERSCMLVALDQSTTSSSSSCLDILDNSRRLLAESNSQDDQSDDDIREQKYHFISLVNEYQNRCTQSGNYLLAAEFMKHEQCLRKDEEQRQVDIIKKKHLHDRNKLVAVHQKQLVEFQASWDDFMADFEEKTQVHLTQLETSHNEQLATLEKSFEVEENNNSKPKKKVWSKDLQEYRRRQMIMAEKQRYQEAQEIKLVSDALEEKELNALNSSNDTSLSRRKLALQKQQQAEMDVQMKRIESKRRDLSQQRDTACSKLKQRNKILQDTFDNKHSAECVKLSKSIEQQVKSLIKGID